VVYGFCFERSGRAYLSADETDSEGAAMDACASPATASRVGGNLDVLRDGGQAYCRRAPSRGLVPLSLTCEKEAGGGTPGAAECHVELEGGRSFTVAFAPKAGRAYEDPRRRATPSPPVPGDGVPVDLAGRRGKDLEFLRGRWLSSVDAEATGVGLPIVYEYVFGGDGKASVAIRDHGADGSPLPPCSATADAQLRAGGILIVRTGPEGAECPGDPRRNYPPRVLGCFPSEDGKDPECMLLEEGRRGAGAVFRKAEDRPEP
jgi:hypothetical protein